LRHWRAPFTLERLRPALLILFFACLSVSITAQQIALGLLILCFAAQCIVRRAWPRTPLDIWLALFGAALLLSTLLGPDPLNSLASYRRLWLVAAWFAVFGLVRNSAEAARLLRVWIVAAVVVAAYGVAQHYFGLDLSRWIVGEETHLESWADSETTRYRVKALQNMGITYGHNLLLPLLGLCGWILAPGLAAGRRLLLAGGLFTSALALLFTFTRGAWLAALGALFCGALARGRRVAVAVGGVALLAGMALLFSGGSVWRRVLSIPDLQANAERLQIWRANLAMLAERPLTGFGVGNHDQFMEPYYAAHVQSAMRDHAHNSFLQIAVDAGLLGLTAWLLLCAVLLRMGWRAQRNAQAEPRYLLFGAWLALLGFLLGGLTQHNFGDAEVVIVWWSLAALLARSLHPATGPSGAAEAAAR